MDVQLHIMAFSQGLAELFSDEVSRVISEVVNETFRPSLNVYRVQEAYLWAQ
jgi:hypothetical protein